MNAKVLMYKKIDHIGIAVADLDMAIAVFSEKLGLKCSGTEEVKEQKVKVAFFQIGETRLELIQPIAEDSAVAKFLTSRGEGIHHIALRVEDIDLRLAELKARGLNLIDEKARTGAHKTKVAFVHPKSTHGVLLELVE